MANNHSPGRFSSPFAWCFLWEMVKTLKRSSAEDEGDNGHLSVSELAEEKKPVSVN